MKQRLRYVLLAILASSFLLAPAFASAEGGSTNSSSNIAANNSASEHATNTTSDKNTTTETHPSSDTTDMDKRLTRLKTDLKINLSDTQKLHIEGRCKSAQGIVKTVGDRVDNGVTTRTQAYAELTSKLNNIVTKLKAKNIDTTTLEHELTVLQTKIATFTTDVSAYKQTLSDLKGVDCITDPTAFQAALTASRSAHDKLTSAVADIKSYVSSTVKPTLQVIRTELESQEQSGSSSNSSNQEGSH
jgi:septation ring formation regulator EzrA